MWSKSGNLWWWYDWFGAFEVREWIINVWGELGCRYWVGGWGCGWGGEAEMLLPGNSSHLEDHRKQQQDYLMEWRDTELGARYSPGCFRDKHAASTEGFGWEETQRRIWVDFEVRKKILQRQTEKRGEEIMWVGWIVMPEQMHSQ